MVLQAAATSLVASLRSPWSVLCGAAALLVVWAAALAAESYWLRPRRLGRALRAQGLGGTAYRFPAGDSAENARQSLEALSKPMPRSCHDVVPRVMPHLHNTVKEHGEVCITWDGPDPKVVIAKPELVTEILSSNSGHFEKLRTNLGDLVCRGVGTYDGEKCARHRRILNPAFHLEKLKAMFPAFSTCCTELVDRWESKLLAAGSEGSVELDVSQEFPVLTGDVITRTSFGSSFTEGRRIFELQVDQAKRLMKLIQYLYIPGFLSFPTENNRRMWENKRERGRREEGACDGQGWGYWKRHAWPDAAVQQVIQFRLEDEHSGCHRGVQALLLRGNGVHAAATHMDSRHARHVPRVAGPGEGGGSERLRQGRQARLRRPKSTQNDDDDTVRGAQAVHAGGHHEPENKQRDADRGRHVPCRDSPRAALSHGSPQPGRVRGRCVRVQAAEVHGRDLQGDQERPSGLLPVRLGAEDLHRQ